MTVVGRVLRASLGVAVVLAAAAGRASASGAGFTPRDVARTRAVTQVAMAPDGSQIAYVLGVPRRA